MYPWRAELMSNSLEGVLVIEIKNFKSEVTRKNNEVVIDPPDIKI